MQQVRLYNSLTKKVEPFEPAFKGKVRIYNCGPTVYKRQHIGNMRRYLFADFLRRTLEFLGYEVRDITNITDVGHLTWDEIDAGEDKLEVAARKQKTTPQDIAHKQTQLFFDDLKKLNIKPAHLYPRATAHIQHMQDMIKTLIEKGHAYQTSTGVYFDVQSSPAYGKLSGNTLDAVAAGKRVEVREEKKHPADFALWVVDPNHLQKWDSPWGVGYPGWHIECSAMASAYLGSNIDIHTGGEDNRFPHHENEIAQSEGATGQPFVRVWMHNRHLRLKGEKLAKREGEQITLDTIAGKGFSLLAFRLFIFGSHYRSPIDFSWEALAEAQSNLESLEHLLRRLLELTQGQDLPSPDATILKDFGNALADDLNTPKALGVLMQYIGRINTALESKNARPTQYLATLQALDAVLGIFSSLQQNIEAETIPEEVKQLAEQREQARQQKQFEKADELRAEIEKRDFRIEDTDGGPRIIRL